MNKKILFLQENFNTLQIQNKKFTHNYLREKFFLLKSIFLITR